MPLFNMQIFFLQTEFEKRLSVINQSYSIQKNRGIQVNHSRLVRETLITRLCDRAFICISRYYLIVTRVSPMSLIKEY